MLMDSSSFSGDHDQSSLFIYFTLFTMLSINGVSDNVLIVSVVNADPEDDDDVVSGNSINCSTAARSGLGHL